MLVLAIDTSTTSASLALARDGLVLAEIGAETGPKRGETLAPALERAFALAGLAPSDVDLYAVCKGPGSFTGLRAGLAFLKGLDLANPRPAAAVSSLRLLALNATFRKGLVMPVTDAHKGEVFMALFDSDGMGGMRRLLPDRALIPGAAAKSATETMNSRAAGGNDILVLGDGLKKHREAFESVLGDSAVFAGQIHWRPRAALLAAAALDRMKKGETQSPADIVPAYARDSDAELRLGPRAGG